MGACDWNFDCGDRSVLAGSCAKWRAQCFECASGDQRWRRTRVGDAAEYVGRGVAGAEAADRVGADERGAGRADAAGSGPLDALELLDGAHFILAIVPDAVLHGRREPLSVPEYHRAMKLVEGFHG